MTIGACIQSLFAMEQVSLQLPDFRNTKCYLGTESKHVVFTLFVMISNIPAFRDEAKESRKNVMTRERK